MLLRKDAFMSSFSLIASIFIHRRDAQIIWSKWHGLKIGRVELHGFLNAYGLGRSPLSEKFLTGSAQIGRVIQSTVHGAVNSETLRQLFGTDTDVYVSKDAFIECLQKNPLLIALFAACVNDP
ncbi:hypothetical protein BHE74_00022633 [Ensete ventricosum]|nr:hypothetical protein GW17_00026208 [Ensete ventricosum]RWW69738.1 hypothetical protein BHE74_00022633 [Ensete ventricosum]